MAALAAAAMPILAPACGSFGVADGSDAGSSAVPDIEAGIDGSSEAGAPADASVDVVGITDSARADADADAAAGGCNGTVNCARLVFVTSVPYDGNLGGIAGADKICQDAADASTRAFVRGRTFVAWISTSTSAAGSRLVAGTKPYVRTDGMGVATSFMQLLMALSLGIDHDENGALLTGDNKVWTGTQHNGSSVSPNCMEWASGLSTNKGKVGITSQASTAWTEQADQLCNAPAHLYCFEK